MLTVLSASNSGWSGYGFEPHPPALRILFKGHLLPRLKIKQDSVYTLRSVNSLLFALHQSAKLLSAVRPAERTLTVSLVNTL